MVLTKDPTMTRTFGAIINNVHTDLAITEYENMIFVVITQNAKLGPMMLVDKTSTRNWEGEQDTYFMSHLFGKEDEWCQSLARYLSDSTHPPKPVLYSILVKEDEKTLNTMEAVRDLINDQKVWITQEHQGLNVEEILT
uniref:Proteasome assembly chaperone 3 n=1 Tax=Cacopsylla melanoneura TaxID=428564 RepID=A0A8D9BQ82_9HEMI